MRGDEDARPLEAIDRDEPPRAIQLEAEPDRAAAVVVASRGVKRRGPKANEVVDVLIAGPPPWDAADAWPLEQVEDWGRASLAWLQNEIAPGCPVAEAAIHTDERSPHLHAVIVPVAEYTRDGPRLGWSRVQRAAAQRISGSAVKTPSGQMRAIQDGYHARVGQAFGLGRGKRGSSRRHEDPDRVQGLEDRVRDAEARRVEAAARADAAVRAQGYAEERAAEAEKRATRARRARARDAADRDRELARASRGRPVPVQARRSDRDQVRGR